ncbi:hypothetical protein N0V83_004066 [Neocucurbitaria cava]|uniref:Uncharacterized protein n=1 Tax=Neocucurbitaria cava TaxID=798079 RepID=A0A9W9CMY9_9PLEO|nr:hypothetical protein N0V83_004066 [Neocucurbitaria cava]
MAELLGSKALLEDVTVLLDDIKVLLEDTTELLDDTTELLVDNKALLEDTTAVLEEIEELPTVAVAELLGSTVDEMLDETIGELLEDERTPLDDDANIEDEPEVLELCVVIPVEVDLELLELSVLCLLVLLDVCREEALRPVLDEVLTDVDTLEEVLGVLVVRRTEEEDEELLLPAQLPNAD